MKNHEIHAAILRIQSEQIALYPDIPAEYYSIDRQHKPREPARTEPNRTEPKQFDLAYQIGKAIARIMRRVLK